MKWIFIFVVLAVVGCKKKTESNGFHVVQYTYADVWASVGIEYEKSYATSYNGSPDTLVFHTNGNITEKYLGKSFTVPVKSYAIDTFINEHGLNEGYFFEHKAIFYKKIDTQILHSGIFFSNLYRSDVSFSHTYKNSLYSSIAIFNKI